VTTVRRYSSATDSPSNCEGCLRHRPEIVIDGYEKFRDGRMCLCQQCAAQALEDHPDLLATAVVALIFKSGSDAPM